MIVAPYKRNPEPPIVAFLTDSASVIDERGRTFGPDELPDGVRVWTSYDIARKLLSDGTGEALCWNGEEIRWRHGQLDERGWNTRSSDVSVIKLPFPDSTGRVLDGLATWRDWLNRYGAAPIGTTGSAAMSLLRATLDRTLFCSMGSPPPLLQTMGGRLEMGPTGAGSFTGQLEQWDMPAAYATELGTISYGGRWWDTRDLLGASHGPEWWARGGRPVFVKARVKIPSDLLGPLIRRPRKRTPTMQLYFEAMTEPRYPTGDLTGLWTWDELQAALDAGCRVRELQQVWVHLGGSQALLPWWEAVQDGRTARGLAGSLAKMTGNALWGRFCMDVTVQGDRTIRRKPKGRVKMVQERLPQRPQGPLPAHDLAETVSGRVRARLYQAMTAADSQLLSAHTDGLWCRKSPASERLRVAGWRQKAAARRLDVLDPQTLRYWPRRRADPEYVMAGRTSSEAPAAFQKLWAEGGYDDE